MKYYQLALPDQPRSTWLIHLQNSKTGERTPLAEYADLVCPRCGKFCYDETFQRGFLRANVFNRPKGDFVLTDDGFFCANQKFRRFVSEKGFSGIEFKQIGCSEWHVLNVAERFEISTALFKTVRGPCEGCGRLREVIGTPQFESEFTTLPQRDQFFSTLQFIERSSPIDRFIFTTKTVGMALRAEGFKGGCFNLLHNEETRVAMEKFRTDGAKMKHIPDEFIYLG